MQSVLSQFSGWRTPIGKQATTVRSCNPSFDCVSCRFGYLWAVHSLYYWWRDQGLAEHGSLQSEHSPCYLNRMDPTEVAVGWGKYTLEVLRAFINRYGAV
jgi:hypothetical protein